MASDNKSQYTGLYFKDPSLFNFAHDRADELNKSLSGYIRELIERDRDGFVIWDDGVQRDFLLEKLNAVLEALGIQHEPHKRVKAIEIGENVSVEEAIDILTGEGIL